MWRALAVESGILIGTGCLFGALASLLGQVLSSRGLQWLSGFPIDPGVRLGTSATVFAAVHRDRERSSSRCPDTSLPASTPRSAPTTEGPEPEATRR